VPAETARRASVDLTQTFLREYRWSVFSVCGAALILGFGLGVLSHLWIDTPAAAVGKRERARKGIVGDMEAGHQPTCSAAEPGGIRTAGESF